MAVATRRKDYQAPGIHSMQEIERDLWEREAAKERLIAFAVYLFPTWFVVRPFRELIAASLELLESRGITRLMIFSPPQMGKSSLFSQIFPAFYIGRHPDHSQILCSYNADLATFHSARARDILREPRYKAVFGDRSDYQFPVELSQTSASTKEWRLGSHRGGMKAAGVGGGITGFGAKILLIDDPVKDMEDATSETLQEKAAEWYRGSAMTRLAPDGVLAITQTRWHQNDLSGYLLNKQRDGGDLFHVLRMPAVAESSEQIKAWCERNFVSSDHYLTADHLINRGRGFS